MTNLKTKIEWCDVTWSPVTGCRKVSAGCAHCYAETWAHRGMGQWKGRAFEDVRVHEDRLDAPLRWRKPRRVFVNSMSDLFHEDVPDEFIDKVFAVMALAPRHTFCVLTKRPDRMRAYLTNLTRPDGQGPDADRWDVARRPLYDAAVGRERERIGIMGAWPRWPLPNVHLGVSCEDQPAADERIPILLDTPAAVRWVSAEPLLGPVDFSPWLDCGHESGGPQGWVDEPGLDWIVVGGESGPGARPCEVGWIRDIVGQCGDAGVPVFVKQLGAAWARQQVREASLRHVLPESAFRVDRKGGDMSEWTEDLRVREFPR